MANPRKPTHLKAVQGTDRVDRANANEPVAPNDIPEPPECLSEIQAEEFVRIVGLISQLNIQSAVDVDMIADLATVTCEIKEDTVLLAEMGSAYYIPSLESGIVRTHPAVGRLTVNRQRAQALRNEFGLSPASRSKVSSAPQKTENPFGQLDGKRA